MRLLLVNANTTASVTDAVVREARRRASPGTEVTGVTGRFGANIVTARPGNVLAAHSVLDLLAEHHEGHDAAILAISFDSGLFAARELAPIPVIGMTEAALHTACLLTKRFGVLTFGKVSTPLYHDLFREYGLVSRIACCRTIELDSIKTYLDTERLHGVIIDQIRSLHATDGVDVVVICGAALAGIARELQAHVSPILLDGIDCAVRQAEALVKMGLPKPRGAAVSGLVSTTSVSGVSPGLLELFQSER